MLQIWQEQLVSEYSESVMNAFEKDVLASRFGFNALSRSDLIEYHTYNIANLVADHGQIENKCH